MAAARRPETDPAASRRAEDVVLVIDPGHGRRLSRYKCDDAGGMFDLPCPSRQTRARLSQAKAVFIDLCHVERVADLDAVALAATTSVMAMASITQGAAHGIEQPPPKPECIVIHRDNRDGRPGFRLICGDDATGRGTPIGGERRLELVIGYGRELLPADCLGVGDAGPFVGILKRLRFSLVRSVFVGSISLPTLYLAKQLTGTTLGA